MLMCVCLVSATLLGTDKSAITNQRWTGIKISGIAQVRYSVHNAIWKYGNTGNNNM